MPFGEGSFEARQAGAGGDLGVVSMHKVPKPSPTFPYSTLAEVGLKLIQNDASGCPLRDLERKLEGKCRFQKPLHLPRQLTDPRLPPISVDMVDGMESESFGARLRDWFSQRLTPARHITSLALSSVFPMPDRNSNDVGTGSGKGQRGPIVAFAWHDNLWVMGTPNGVHFWDLGKQSFVYGNRSGSSSHGGLWHPVLEGGIAGLAVDPLGHVLVGCGGGGAVLWRNRGSDYGDWQAQICGGKAGLGQIDGVAFSECSRYLVAWKRGGWSLYIVSVANPCVYHTLYAMDRVLDVHWNGGKLLVSGSNRVTCFSTTDWSRQSFTCPGTYPSARIGPNGCFALVGSGQYLQRIPLTCNFTGPQILAMMGTSISDAGSPEVQIKTIAWSPCGQRVAISFTHDSVDVRHLVAILAVEGASVFPIGWAKGPADLDAASLEGCSSPFPSHIAFKPAPCHSNFGAELAICWSNGSITQIPMLFSRERLLA